MADQVSIKPEDENLSFLSKKYKRMTAISPQSALAMYLERKTVSLRLLSSEWEEMSTVQIIKDRKSILEGSLDDGKAVKQEAVTFADLQLREDDVEEALRENIDMICDEEESMLIVGKQVRNAQHGIDLSNRFSLNLELF